MCLGLISDLVRKHPPTIINTSEGHLFQEHKNLRSTKNNNQPDIMMATEKLEFPGAWAHLAHVKIVDTIGNISSDQTGRFPITSSLGCKYIAFLHDCNINSILAEPLE